MEVVKVTLPSASKSDMVPPTIESKLSEKIISYSHLEAPLTVISNGVKSMVPKKTLELESYDTSEKSILSGNDWSLSTR